MARSVVAGWLALGKLFQLSLLRYLYIRNTKVRASQVSSSKKDWNSSKDWASNWCLCSAILPFIQNMAFPQPEHKDSKRRIRSRLKIPMHGWFRKFSQGLSDVFADKYYALMRSMIQSTGESERILIADDKPPGKTKI